MKWSFYLSGVDLEVAARHLQLEVLILGRGEVLEHVLGGQGVDAVLGVLLLPVELPAHGVGLARARLPVGEARCHAALEDVHHQRFSRVPGVQKNG